MHRLQNLSSSLDDAWMPRISVKFYEIPKLLFEIFPRQRRFEYIDSKICPNIIAKFSETTKRRRNEPPRKDSEDRLEILSRSKGPRSILRNTDAKSLDKVSRRRMATKFHFHWIRSNPAGGRSTRSLPP